MGWNGDGIMGMGGEKGIDMEKGMGMGMGWGGDGDGDGMGMGLGWRRG